MIVITEYLTKQKARMNILSKAIQAISVLKYMLKKQTAGWKNIMILL